MKNHMKLRVKVNKSVRKTQKFRRKSKKEMKNNMREISTVVVKTKAVSTWRKEVMVIIPMIQPKMKKIIMQMMRKVMTKVKLKRVMIRQSTWTQMMNMRMSQQLVSKR